MDEKTYMKKWIELNEKMAKERFIWGTLEGEEDYEQYMSFNLYKMKKTLWEDIQIATKRIGHILNKTYNLIYQDNRLFSKLGLPSDTWEAAMVPNKEIFSYFTRLDLIVNNGEIKVIEVNSDTPTGYLETSVANRIICEDQGCKSPNDLENAIWKAWHKIIDYYDISYFDTVYFTSYGYHDEDRETVLFNMRNSGLNKTRYIPIEEIIVADDGLYDEEGQKIEYLYRLYPLEYLPDDTDEKGKKIGNIFLDHIATGRVKIINPPSAFMMQSKAVMAIIWEIANTGEFFTKDEQEDVKKYFLPTFFENSFFTHTSIPYVQKPIFGREGGGVKIIDEHSRIVEQDIENWYDEWSKIYQQYIEMPDYTLDTWTGKYTGKLLIGSFLIGGEPSGLFLRVGEKITGNLSMFCGISIDENE
ncbi:glutathionylspermidine synthase family protein [Heyndrickxia ginsengihumi]|uniref:glutathionylspermidine synthase family protein n=1 Tax=Heyndrickxia ginsengihumi TaxID=363870 RepID=UPI0004B17C51|nr:glutathionylspermidine synthase family protein [Heyndrickxia ginsengihumi]